VYDSEYTVPSTVQDIEDAIRSMDKRFKTSFYRWIRSEENIAYMCTTHASLFEEYWKTDPTLVIRALKWLTQDWSIPGTAELVIKLFYHWKIDSSKFIFLIAATFDHWPLKRLISLLNVLLIGDPPKVVARFLFQFYQLKKSKEMRFESTVHVQQEPWTQSTYYEFMKALSTQARWTVRFYDLFMSEYEQLYCSEKQISAIQDDHRSSDRTTEHIPALVIYALQKLSIQYGSL